MATTLAPTTVAPTTVSPTTAAPTTLAPTTLATTLAPTTAAPPADYYMDVAGSDVIACGTVGSPCATMQYILDGNTTNHPSGAISAGDTIKVNSGTYTSASQGLSGANDQIDVNDTTNHLNITITATTPGSPPLFQGDDTDHMRIYVYANVTGVEISYIDWCSSTNGYGGGSTGPIRISAKETTIDNCEIYNGGVVGVLLYDTRGVTISNNTIHDIGPNDDRSLDAHGIAIWDTQLGTGSSWAVGERLYIYNNTIYNCNGDGFQDVSSQYTYYIDIEANTIYNCGENNLDFKYTQYVKIHENNLYSPNWRVHHTGIHDGANNAATLSDSTASWTVDALIGLVTRNYPDDSFGTITDNDATTATATLGSGSDNDWDTGDFYLIGTDESMAQHALINIGEGVATYQYFYIWNNTLHTNSAGAIDPNGTVQYWYIWNNVIYNTSLYPRWNGGTIAIDGGTNMTVVFNTVYNCAENANGATIRQTSGLFAPGAASNDIKNNIFWNNGDDGVNDYGNIQAGGSADIDYNYVYPTSPGQTGTNAVTSSDPRFVDEDNDDFHLASNSPCIEQATPLSDSGIFTPTLDKDGVTRDVTSPDIGAYEYTGSVTTLAPTTLAPTTLAPTTVLTTLAPTTTAPTTVAPTTAAPTTIAPTTLDSTTLAPTTLGPTTSAPTTLEPTTVAPTTVPTTAPPTTPTPTTLQPTTAGPTTKPPTTLSPTTVSPTTLAPTTEAPTTIAPTTIAPTTSPPTTLSPTTLAPTTLAATTLAPTTLSTTLAPTTTLTTLAPTTVVPTTAPPAVCTKGLKSIITLEVDLDGNICW